MVDSIDKWLKENGITEVECLVPDMTGNARGKFIPAHKFIKEDSRLPESILVQTVTGEYVDEHWDLVQPLDSDMLLEPDPSSVRIVPWAEEPTAQIIHDCYLRNGDPHPMATRNVLKKVLALYEKEGWTPVVAPEVEFYLVSQNTDPDYELSPPPGRSGRREIVRQSYSIDGCNEYEPIVNDMYRYCEAQGLDVDTLIHESGAAQLEINFLHGNALDLADQVFTFKRTMRETAFRHGIYATFMAKPMTNEPGSAMHIHQSVIDKNGNNIFVNADASESDLFRYYIGGLQRYIPNTISFFAPNVNSYRRFAKDIAAPVNLEWGYDNRTAGIRVPDSSPAGKRVENRFPGVDVNPYLAFAASLACGYLGMKKKINPTPPCEGHASEDGEIELPRNLLQALNLLTECPDLDEVFGADFIRAYAAVKMEEFEAFNRVITSWEREYLLLNV